MSTLPLLLYPPKTRADREWLKDLKKEGLIRTIGPRLYTSVPEGSVERTVRDSWPSIVSNLFPDAVLSHRSALEYRPTLEGNLYLTSTTNREVVYPGLTLKFLRGPGPLKNDSKFLNLHASSLPRALLENLSTIRKGTDSKNVAPEEIERLLENILLNQGEQKLNELRDSALEISKQLKWDKEFKRINQLIGALLGTKSAKVLQSEIARARALHIPYDVETLKKLQFLFSELRNYPFSVATDDFTAANHFSNKAFFEAYFSNYIEGTRFEIEEAEEIIFDKKIPDRRPKDAHDIIGTYQLVSDPNLMQQVPKNAEEFTTYLKQRHEFLMKNRPEALPGRFKELPNRAGNTTFVHPDYVEGTLIKAFRYYQDLPAGMPRAIYIMFLVTEVHPFADGNGRIARVMMNAELFSLRLPTIIIPNVYRDDYIGALRALSRRDRPQPLVKMLLTAQKFSHLEFSPYPAILKSLQERNWFSEPDDGKIII